MSLATLLPYDIHTMRRGRAAAVLGSACFPCSGLKCRMSYGPAVARLPKELSCMSWPRNLQVLPAAKRREPLWEVIGPVSSHFTSHNPIRVALWCSSDLCHCRLIIELPLLGVIVVFIADMCGLPCEHDVCTIQHHVQSCSLSFSIS